MTPAVIDRLDRIAAQRRETVRAGIDGARDVLTNPLLTREQRETWGVQYLRCVLAQLDDLDRQAWDLTLEAVSA